MRTWIARILIISVLCGSISVTVQAAPVNLYAQSAVLMDADSGRILFEKNGQEIRPMASTTKIMTCILTLEQADLEEQVTASANAAAQPKVHLGMQTGEHFRLGDLLYSLMLESHNDTAVAIAEHVGGSVERFAEKMNEKAVQLGCKDTHFVTPNGLDSQDAGGIHATTAEDLARILRYCIMQSPKKEAFLNITETSSYAFSNVEGTRSFSCANHNAFLGMMEGALTGKTGFTGNAGYCYVGALQRDGKTLIVALLACGWPNNRNYKWSDTRQLMEYGLEHFAYRDIKKTFSFAPIPVKEGIPDGGSFSGQAYAMAVPESDVSIRMLLGAEDRVTVKARCSTRLTAPVAAGQTVGDICYYLNGEELCRILLRARDSVEKITLGWCAEKIISRFLLS